MEEVRRCPVCVYVKDPNVLVVIKTFIIMHFAATCENTDTISPRVCLCYRKMAAVCFHVAFSQHNK